VSQAGAGARGSGATGRHIISDTTTPAEQGEKLKRSLVVHSAREKRAMMQLNKRKIPRPGWVLLPNLARDLTPPVNRDTEQGPQLVEPEPKGMPSPHAECDSRPAMNDR
jgi:hypothetical protein